MKATDTDKCRRWGGMKETDECHQEVGVKATHTQTDTKCPHFGSVKVTHKCQHEVCVGGGWQPSLSIRWVKVRRMSALGGEQRLMSTLGWQMSVTIEKGKNSDRQVSMLGKTTGEMEIPPFKPCDNILKIILQMSFKVSSLFLLFCYKNKKTFSSILVSSDMSFV